MNLGRLLANVRILFNCEKIHREIEAEREFHLSMAADDAARRGLSGEQAKMRAARRFGNALQMHEDAFSAKGAGSLFNAYNDCRYAVRRLAKNPTRTVAIVLTLALGIGVNVAVFAIMQAVLFHPLPFANSGALVTIHQISKNGIEGVSYPNFEDWRAFNKSFESMAAFATDSSALRVAGETQRAYGAIVSANLFRMLAVHPLRGRLFDDSEDQPHSARNVLISDRLWRTRFQSREDIVGQILELDGFRYRIIGVVPEQQAFPIQNDGTDYWITVSIDAQSSPWGGSIRKSRGFPRYDAAIARLRPSVTLVQGQAEMNVIAAGIARQHPQFDLRRGVQVRSAVEEVVGKIRPLFWILFAATCCIWAISCSNAATLLLVEALGRTREFALRAALGAARRRIILQVLVESLSISLLGGAAGVMVAYVLVLGFRRLGSLNVPRIEGAHIDAAVLTYAVVASVLATMVFGLAPSLVSTRHDVIGCLKQLPGPQFGGGKPKVLTFQPGALLIFGQVAICLLLCCSATVLTASFWKILHQSRGFDSSQVLTAAIGLPGGAYPEGSAKITHFYDDLLSKVRGLPGVTSASVTQSLPLSGQDNDTQLEILGGGTPRNTITSLRFVESRYFQTLHIPLLRGNFFVLADRRESAPVAIVNDEFVRRFIHTADPVGARVLLGWGGNAPKTIVGVVGGIRHQTLDSQPTPEIYVPIAQFPVSQLSLVIRTVGTPTGLPKRIRAAVHNLDPNATVDHIRTLEDYLLASAAPQRFLMWILVLFAANALVLAMVGLYGSLGYATASRQREFGIRLALGAPPRALVRMVVRYGLSLAALGVFGGLLLTIATAPLLRGWLFETSPVDVPSLFLASVGLLCVATLACWLPARRAASANPGDVLRSA